MKRAFVVAIGLAGFIAFALTTVVASGSDGAVHASAVIRDVSGNVIGEAKFTEDAAGILHVNVHVKGLSEGEHGIHIHNTGACTPTFAAAGSHHNPLGLQHGLDNANGAHAGDLPAFIVNGAGVGHLDGKSDRATLSEGPTSVFDTNGSAIVIHASPDDQVTDPTGNSGARVACGVIEQD
jgi:Cu-Zn family superoxide dismutase